MNLKDKIIGMIKRAFGIKALTSIEEIENIDTYAMSSVDSSINSMNEKTEYSENQFDEGLKVNSNSISAVPNFQNLSSEIRTELLNSFNEFKQTVLESEEIQHIKQSQEEGKIGETPFMCFAELDSNGKLKSTIIVTKNSCIKTTEEDDGSISYQETRRGKDGLQVVINDKNSSMYIRGGNRLTQKKINEIRDFSNINRNSATKMPSKFDDVTTNMYKKTLQELGVKQDIDLNDDKRFSYAVAGKSNKINENTYRLDEIGAIIDKENNRGIPEIITINSKMDGKISRKKFRLTENGKYLDESSFKVIDGKPQYSLVDYEQIKQMGAKLNLDVNYIDRYKNFTKENKPLIPNDAMNIHKSMEIKQEKEQNSQDEKQQDSDRSL